MAINIEELLKKNADEITLDEYIEIEKAAEAGNEEAKRWLQESKVAEMVNEAARAMQEAIKPGIVGEDIRAAIERASGISEWRAAMKPLIEMDGLTHEYKALQEAFKKVLDQPLRSFAEAMNNSPIQSLVNTLTSNEALRLSEAMKTAIGTTKVFNWPRESLVADSVLLPSISRDEHLTGELVRGNRINQELLEEVKQLRAERNQSSASETTQGGHGEAERVEVHIMGYDGKLYRMVGKADNPVIKALIEGRPLPGRRDASTPPENLVKRVYGNKPNIPGVASGFVKEYFGWDGNLWLPMFREVRLIEEMGQWIIRSPGELPHDLVIMELTPLDADRVKLMAWPMRWETDEAKAAVQDCFKALIEYIDRHLKRESAASGGTKDGQPAPTEGNGENNKLDRLIEPIKPSKDDPLNPKWFDYYYACKQARIRYTLKDIANDSNRSYGYVRQEHVKYKSEHT
jgi:hypothetical protein